MPHKRRKFDRDRIRGDVLRVLATGREKHAALIGREIGMTGQAIYSILMDMAVDGLVTQERGRKGMLFYKRAAGPMQAEGISDAHK